MIMYGENRAEWYEAVYVKPDLAKFLKYGFVEHTNNYSVLVDASDFLSREFFSSRENVMSVIWVSKDEVLKRICDMHGMDIDKSGKICFKYLWPGVAFGQKPYCIVSRTKSPRDSCHAPCDSKMSKLCKTIQHIFYKTR